MDQNGKKMAGGLVTATRCTQIGVNWAQHRMAGTNQLERARKRDAIQRERTRERERRREGEKERRREGGRMARGKEKAREREKESE